MELTRQQFPFDRDKFKELMLFAAQESQEDHYFGATKLNKILFFADFLAYGLTGEPITGATYQREKNGPVPQALKPMERELVNSQDAFVMKKPFFNYTQHRLVPMRTPNVSRFSAEELDLINDVIRMLRDHTADDASRLSHERSFAWRVADPGETIPYEAVFLSGRRANKEDIRRGKELAKEHGWLAAAQ
jgi:hypothetical protein